MWRPRKLPFSWTLTVCQRRNVWRMRGLHRRLQCAEELHAVLSNLLQEDRILEGRCGHAHWGTGAQVLEGAAEEASIGAEALAAPPGRDAAKSKRSRERRSGPNDNGIPLQDLPKARPLRQKPHHHPAAVLLAATLGSC